MPSLLRILDANTNRAREALRVMEDAARFLLNDANLSASLKQLRHDLAKTMAQVNRLEQHRDTPGDVGTTIFTEAEQSRQGAGAVALAAGKRLSEALRAIEEYLKPTPTCHLAPVIEQLRYRGYELERQLNVAMAHGRPRQWQLCLLLTESLCLHPWQKVLEQAIAGGVDCVQVREKNMDAQPLKQRVEQVVAIARPHGVSVIVNDRPDVAMAAQADGVHLGQHDLPLSDVRKLVGHQLLVGISTSTLDQARAAMQSGADYCGLGPMYPTTTVDNKPHVVGLAYLKAFVQTFPDMPHLAIGGIDSTRAAALQLAGAQGLAVSRAICAADDPTSACQHLLAPVNANDQTQ